MRGLLSTMIVAGLVAVSLLTAAEVHAAPAPPSPPVSAPLADPQMKMADHDWLTAIAKGDKAAAAKLLDPGFTWTDANGKIRTRAEVAQTLPTPALGAEVDAQTAGFTYDKVGVVEVNKGTMHVLRVWVKRPAGWRALVYQEVKSLDAPPTVTPGPGKVCDNPCKSVPYQAKNADEKAVIEAYTGLESSAVGHNADGFDAHTATEFIAASSNSNKLLDKATRVAELRESNMSGLAPTPLISAKLFDFPGAVIMISLQRPDKGKDLHITRVWIKRDGHWVATLSYQTAIPPAQ